MWEGVFGGADDGGGDGWPRIALAGGRYAYYAAYGAAILPGVYGTSRAGWFLTPLGIISYRA